MNFCIKKSFYFLLLLTFVLSGCCIQLFKDDCCQDKVRPATHPKELRGALNGSTLGDSIKYLPEGSAIMKNQLIVDIPDDYTGDIGALKSRLNVESEKLCPCGGNTIRLWEFNSADLDSIPIETKGAVAEAELGGPETADFNYILFDQPDWTPTTVVLDPEKVRSGMNLPSTTFDPNAPIVAILDTGLDFSHPGFLSGGTTKFWSGAGYSGGFNFLSPGTIALDDNDHGTLVGGVIHQNLKGRQSVNLMSLKTHNKDGYAKLSDALCAIEFANCYNAFVVNMSWGYYTSFSSIFHSLLEKYEDDMLLVTSAGNTQNDNTSKIHFPSGFQITSIVEVGSTDSGGDLADFSNYSITRTDVCTIGKNVTSLIVGGQTGVKSGTSLSAPVVASLAVVIKSRCPSLTPQQVKDKILELSTNDPALSSLVLGGNVLEFNSAYAILMSSPPCN